MKAPRIEVLKGYDNLGLPYWQYRVVAKNGERVGPHDRYDSFSNAKRGCWALLRALTGALMWGRIYRVSE